MITYSYLIILSLTMNHFNINLSEMSDERSILNIYWHKAQQFLFNYPDRQQLKIHHSTLSNKALFYSRLFSFILLTFVYIWTMASLQKSLFQNVMYLTMVGYLISWLYFGLALQDYCLNFGGKPLTKKLGYFIEIFYQIGFCLQLPITLVFWGFLFKIVLNTQGVTTQIIIINGFLHGAPLVLLAIDFALNFFSFHINHLPVLIILDVIYLMINLVYSLKVKPIYGPIDWVSVGSYIIAVSSILLSILVHYIGRVVYRKWKCHIITANSINQALLLAPQSQRQSLESFRNTNQNQTFSQRVDL